MKKIFITSILLTEAASKICVTSDFVWPDERESLKAKYPGFINYVKDNLNVDSWWKNWK